MIRNILLSAIFFLLVAGFSACDDDEKTDGHPELALEKEVSLAYFGDSIPFTATVSDQDQVPLSTLKAQLFFGDEMVSETVIRTKAEGEYSGKIFVPFLKDIPDATATLKFVAQNIRFAIAQETFDVSLSRPEFSHLTLVTESGNYQMEPAGNHRYVATEDFPQKVKGYIEAPAYGENGNPISFGWGNEGAITQGSEADINFSNYSAGVYDITFNILTYEASPFITLEFAGTEMSMVDENNFKVEMDLEQDQNLEISGIPNIDEWSMDEDYFVDNGDGTYNFRAVSGKYRVTANFEHEYFIVEAMNGNDLASLQSDGTGAIWIIGEGIGKPSLDNQVGWNTDKALCMAQISPKKYQVTVVAGTSINGTNINFKFFHQKGWGGEFTSEALSSESDLIFVGDGANGRDPGNLGLFDGVTLEEGQKYVLEVDVTSGIDSAVLSVSTQ
jgi:hypothetical protein